MNQPSNLVLRIRLETLISGVEQVRQLLNVMEATRRKAKRLRTTIEELRGMHRQKPDFDVSKQVDELTRPTANPTRTLGFTVEKIKSDAATLKRFHDELDSSLTDFFDAWDELVPTRFGDPESVLAKQVEVNLHNTVEAVRARLVDHLDDLTTGRRTTAEIWTALYSPEIDETTGAVRPPVLTEARELFSDYVEVLGGVALRGQKLSLNKRDLRDDVDDAGQGSDDDKSFCWHEELWAMADQLVSDVANSWSEQLPSATLPAKHAALQASRWRVLRFGFDQWSVWALPLVAFEFGIELEESWPMAAQTRLRTRYGEAGRQILLADAIGARTLGPAYLAALCFLQLKPPDGDAPAASIEGSPPTDAERVRFVRHRLVSIQPDSGLATFVDKLYGLWTAESADDAAAPDDQFGVVDDGLAEKFRRVSPGFDELAWADVTELNFGALTDVNSTLSYPISHLLNFAWYQRINTSPERSESVTPDDIEGAVIAAAVRLLQAASEGPADSKAGTRRRFRP